MIRSATLPHHSSAAGMARALARLRKGNRRRDASHLGHRVVGCGAFRLDLDGGLGGKAEETAVPFSHATGPYSAAAADSASARKIELARSARTISGPRSEQPAYQGTQRPTRHGSDAPDQERERQEGGPKRAWRWDKTDSFRCGALCIQPPREAGIKPSRSRPGRSRRWILPALR
jgi:hypothetical protein